MGYSAVKTWRTATKRRLVVGFGGKCAVCGLVDDDIVYDFHHMDRRNKEVVLTGKIMSWQRIMSEVIKCVMLCVICHRKVHAGKASVPSDALRFDENLPISYGLINTYDDTRDECPGGCGGTKLRWRSACSIKCFGLSRRLDRPNDMDELRDNVIKKGFWSVAREHNVTDNTIRKWLRGAGYEVPRFRKSPLVAQW